MYRPSRRAAILVGAVLAAAVVAGGGAAALLRDPGTTVALQPLGSLPGQAGDPTSSPVPTTAAPSSAAPSAAAAADSPSAREPSVATAESEAPAAAKTKPPHDEPSPTESTDPLNTTQFGPLSPGEVMTPYRAHQTTWDATSNGIHLHLTMSGDPHAGSPTTWHLTGTDGADCCSLFLLFEDGGRYEGSEQCYLPTASMDVTHTFNKPGRHYFLAEAMHTDCRRSGGIYGSFDVGTGSSTAQGPSLPQVQFDSSSPVAGHERDRTYMSLFGQATDTDGYVTKFVVDYGDGTSDTFGGDENPCQETSGGWPASSTAWLPAEPPPYHHYTVSKSYTLTLTAYSAGCDGTQVQTATASFLWRTY